MTNMRRVYWSGNFQNIALCSNSQILICSKSLEIQASIKELSKFKSGTFDENGAFVYSTSSHVKYIYQSSNTHGILCSIDNPVYLAYFKNRHVFYITRDGKVEMQRVNTAEYEFKIALKQRKINDVIKILKSGQLVGTSIVEYLKEENCADIALLFEKDVKTRFELCLTSADIQKAYETALEIKERDTYLKLAHYASKQGFFNIAEKSLQQVKQFDKLSFYYTVQGSTSKLTKMQNIAISMNDRPNRFTNSIFLSDIRERVKVLVESNQIALAYMCAKTHNLTDLIPPLEDAISKIELCDNFKEQVEEKMQKGKALLGCRPVFVTDESFISQNWPHKMNKKATIQERIQSEAPVHQEEEFFDAPESKEESGDIADLLEEEPTKDEPEDELGDLGGDDDDLLGLDDEEDDILKDLGADEDDDMDDLLNEETQETESEIYVPPTHGQNSLTDRVRDSIIPAYHVAIGDFPTAFEMLKKQIGLANPAPLKAIFTEVYSNARAEVPTLPQLNHIDLVMRNSSGRRPFVSVTLSLIKEIFKQGFDATSGGKFTEARDAYTICLQTLPLFAATTQEEANEAGNLITSLVEYIISMKLEIARKEETDIT